MTGRSESSAIATLERPAAVTSTAAGRLLRRRDSGFAWRMLSPALIVIGAVLLFPLGYSLWTSFNTVGSSALSLQFDGVSNYRDMVHNPLFAGALLNTLYFAVITIAGTVILGLAIALLLNQPFHGNGFLKLLVIAPWAVSQVVVGIVWEWIFNGNFGIFNAVLNDAGLISSYKGWLSDPGLAMPLVAVSFIWSAAPFAVIMYLAQLQAIPVDLYKAARIDGASASRRFLHVTLPALRYTTLVILVVASLDGLLAFTLIYIMTGGGPGTATTVLSWLGYQTSFADFDLGTGAAMFYVLVAIMLVVTGIYLRILRSPQGAGSKE